MTVSFGIRVLHYFCGKMDRGVWGFCTRLFQCEDGGDTCVAQAQVSNTSAIDPDSPSSLELSNSTHTEPCQLEHQSDRGLYSYVRFIAQKQQMFWLNEQQWTHLPITQAALSPWDHFMLSGRAKSLKWKIWVSFLLLFRLPQNLWNE
jgi:hypothetical protein